MSKIFKCKLCNGISHQDSWNITTREIYGEPFLKLNINSFKKGECFWTCPKCKHNCYLCWRRPYRDNNEIIEVKEDILKCSWDLCKYNKKGECQNIDKSYAISDGKISHKNFNMIKCKLYSRRMEIEKND